MCVCGVCVCVTFSFVKAGMSYINDPAQIVFTSNQGEVVKQVLQTGREGGVREEGGRRG